MVLIHVRMQIQLRQLHPSKNIQISHCWYILASHLATLAMQPNWLISTAQPHNPAPAEWRCSAHNMAKFSFLVVKVFFFFFSSCFTLWCKSTQMTSWGQARPGSLWRWCQDLQTAVRPSGHAGCLQAGEAEAVGDQSVGLAIAPPRQNQSFVSFFHQPTLIAELADSHAVCDHSRDGALNPLWCTADLFEHMDGQAGVRSFGAASGLNMLQLLHRLWTDEAWLLNLNAPRKLGQAPPL